LMAGTGVPGDPNGPPSPRPRVLIAEDEEQLREALQELLEEKGYQVVAVTRNGAEAIELGKDLKPDLVLVDYRMPGADGVTVTAALKEDSPNTQIVMFTAYDETSLSIDATRAGIFAFLVKGCAPSLIFQALESAWKQKQRLDAR
jgi:DNA-binding NarL/FixJ family response regulator